MNYETYDSANDTLEHSAKVFSYAQKLSSAFLAQTFEHDKSKLENPEKALFDEYTPKLKTVEYNSDEYKQFLKDLKPALDHHYGVNRHHPEHHHHGIQDMNLIDILEYFCDCVAAAKRMKDGGDPVKSFEINQKKHGYSDDLKKIFLNTLSLVEEKQDSQMSKIAKDIAKEM